LFGTTSKYKRENAVSTCDWLVGGFNHLEKYESQWEGLCHILWEIQFMFETTNQIFSFW
jgi:hypothetical protein